MVFNVEKMNQNANYTQKGKYYCTNTIIIVGDAMSQNCSCFYASPD